MIGIFFLALLLVPLAELYVIVQVAGSIGVLETIALLILVSFTGAWLLKREGLAAWGRMNAQLQAGKVPAKEVTDGAMILFGGALLLTPGFLTDIVGLLFVLPPSRAAIKGVFRRGMAGWVVKKHPAGYAGYKVYDATVTRSRRRTESANPSPTTLTPGSTLPEADDAGDSPGRG